MKKYIVLMICLFLVSSLFLTSCAKKQKEEETIKIGAIYPLSGFLSRYGETEKIATEFTVNEINKQGGINGKEIKVIYEDGKCSGLDALTAAKKLVEKDGIKIILGGTCSSETLAVAPYAKDKQILMFTSVSSSPYISNYSNIFRNTIITSEEGKILARLAQKHNYKKIAIITENNDFPISIRDGFMEVIEKDKIVYDELFNYGEQDFRTYLTKIKFKNPDALFVFALGGNTGGRLIKQFYELNITTNIYGAEVPGTNDFLEIAGDAANGIVFTDVPELDRSNKKLSEILSYFDKYGVTPVSDYFVAARYDSIQVLKEAIEKCGENNSCIENYIKNKEFNGLIGKHTYDNNGDVRGINISIKKIIDRQPRLIGE